MKQTPESVAGRYGVEIELALCPFCGSDDVHLGWYLSDISGVREEDFGDGADGPEGAMYSVECRGCKFESDNYFSAQIIADKWNVRTIFARIAELESEVAAGKALAELAQDVCDVFNPANERERAAQLKLRDALEVFTGKDAADLTANIESATESWKGVDTDEFMKEVRGNE